MLAVTLLGLGYGLFARQLLLDLGGAGASPGAWDIVIESVSSVQFMTFVALPAWLLYRLLRGRTMVAPSRLIRLGSGWAVWAHEIWRDARLAGLVAIALLSAWFLSSIGLPLRSVPGEFSSARTFAELGIAPMLAVALEFAYLLFFLLAVQTILVSIRLRGGAFWVQLLVCLVVWAWAAMSLNGTFDTPSATSAPYYLDLAAVISKPAVGALAPLLTALVGAAAVVSIWASDRAALGAGRLVPWRWLVFTAAALILLSISVARAAQHGAGFVEVLGSVFAGAQGTMTQFLLEAFLFVGFAYLSQLRQSDLRHGLLGPLLLRYGSTTRLVFRETARDLARVPLYISIITFSSGSLYLMAGGRLIGGGADLGPVAVQLLINGTLQVAFYVLICSSAGWLSRSQLAPLLAAGSILALCAARGALPGISPFAISGLANVKAGWASVAETSLILSACIIVIAAAAALSTRVKGIPL